MSENASEGTGTEPAGVGTEPTGTEPEHSSTEPGSGPGQQEPESFSREYVQSLRDEAAASRIKAKRADDAEARLHELAIEKAVRDVLVSADDLQWSAELADENGFPDEAKILTAAEELVARKPHLSRVRGDVGQGQRGDVVPAVSLSGLLRAGS